MINLGSPKPGPRNGKLTNRDNIGHCVRCHHGIYVGQPHYRGRGKWLGLLCHDCAHHLGLIGATNS